MSAVTQDTKYCSKWVRPTVWDSRLNPGPAEVCPVWGSTLKPAAAEFYPKLGYCHWKHVGGEAICVSRCETRRT